MSKCFKTGRINRMELANRFVRSATWEGMATEDGAVTLKLKEIYAALAEGGVGLTITGHSFVDKLGQAGPWQLGAYKDELVPGLKELTDMVHNRGGRIVMQLAHAGHFAAKQLTQTPPWVASDFEGLSNSPRREMTADDIQALTTSFTAAASRAQEAGFDGVQIHSAHGYLLSQFLSPLFNRRTDDYGGNIENRARIHVNVVRAIRDAVGLDFPILMKLNCGDFVEGGLDTTDAVQAGRLLAEAGLDALEVSGGVLTGGRLSPSRMVKNAEQEAYFQNEAQAFRQALSIPIILVGGIKSFETAETLINDGTTDFISMCRPFIREPNLVKRWQSGDLRPALCKSDNACFKPAMEGQGVYCVTAEREKASS
jgi:2,4-dienoyl-CoA reductase-like NADH-dependent reductase (Old Yellow Enzyme family)